MKEETTNLMPKRSEGFYLKQEDRYEIIATDDLHRRNVTVDEKMSGDTRLVVFTNKNDSPVIIKILRA
jgi:hypothetical protein